MRRERSQGVTAWPILVGFFTLFVGSCVGNYSFKASAPPVATAARLVEESPEVARALGAPVKVSLVVSRTLQRSPLAVVTGKDHVTLHTQAKGTHGTATLHVSAMNLDGQGWSGRFSLDSDGRQVFRDGAYITDGGGRILEGTFTPSGEAIVKKEASR